MPTTRRPRIRPTRREVVRKKALEFVEAAPKGLRYSELMARLTEALQRSDRPIIAFGQACAYKLFSHKSYIVVPSSDLGCCSDAGENARRGSELATTAERDSTWACGRA